MLIRKIDWCFLFLSLLFAIAGQLLGIQMGIVEDFALAPVHAHANLVGFVALALFGIAYRIGWAAKDALALVHFAVAGAGAILLPLGIWLAIRTHQPAVAIVGSMLTLASILLFLVNCVRALSATSAQLRTPAGAAVERVGR